MLRLKSLSHNGVTKLFLRLLELCRTHNVTPSFFEADISCFLVGGIEAPWSESVRELMDMGAGPRLCQASGQRLSP